MDESHQLTHYYNGSLNIDKEARTLITRYF